MASPPHSSENPEAREHIQNQGQEIADLRKQIETLTRLYAYDKGIPPPPPDSPRARKLMEYYEKTHKEAKRLGSIGSLRRRAGTRTAPHGGRGSSKEDRQ